MRKIYLLLLFLLICEACSKPQSITQYKAIDPIQSFFIDLPDSIFIFKYLKYNFDRYGININDKWDRGRIFSSSLDLEYKDSVISNNHHINIYLGEGFDVPCRIDLRVLNIKTKTYSIINKYYAELWDVNSFHIYRYKKGLLIECTKEIMPEITLSDFIKPSYISLFTQDYINNPYLIYTYQNDRNDTLNVKFEPRDHPFFEENKHWDSVIAQREIFLVWKKDRFVKVGQ